MFRILDRYIFRELLAPFLIGLGLFTFVFLMNLLLELARIAIRGDVGIVDVARVLLWSLPHILALTIPMSVLLANNLGLGRMSADNEITVLHASGVGLMRIGRPIFAFSLAAMLLTGWVFMRLVPDTNRRARAYTYEMAKKQLHKGIQPKAFYDRYGGYVIFTFDIDEDTNVWSDVFVADMSQPEEPRLSFAKSGRLHYNESEKYVVLQMESGESFTLDLKHPEGGSRSVFDKETVLINLENMMPTAALGLTDREMGLRQLWDEMQRRVHAGMKWRQIAVELHKKFAVPVACVVFGIIGLAIGARNRSRGKSAGFVVSLAIIVVYYIFITTGERMGDSGQLPPWLSMWAANLVIGGVGSVMLVLAAREIEVGLWDKAATAGIRTLAVVSGLVARRSVVVDSPRQHVEGAGPTGGPMRRRRAAVVIRIPRLGPDFPRILDRYVIRQWLKNFVLVLAAITAMYLIVDFSKIVDDISENQVPTETWLDHYKYALPNIVFLVLGPATLVATLWSLGVMNRNNEIIAMKASGISIYRAVLPVFLLAVALSLASFYVYDHIIPVSQRRALTLREEILKGPKRSHGMESGRWMWGEDGRRLFNYSAYDTRQDLMHNVKVFELDPDRFSLRQVVSAQRAHWADGGWRFEDAWKRTFEPDGTTTFAHQKLLVQPYDEDPGYFVAEKKAADELSYGELKDYIRQLSVAGFSVRSLRVRLEQKLALPFVPLVMTLIGIPFALRIGKRGNLFGVGASVALVAIFWAFVAAFGPLGETGVLPALLAAWAPNIIFAVAGMYLFLNLDT